MVTAVAIVGWIIAAVGVLGVLRPQQFAVIRDWPPEVLLYVSAGIRVLLGALFIVAAPSCRFPRAVYAIGIIALAAAAALVLLGPSRVEVIVQWWFRQPPLFIRAVYLADVVFGGFLAYAGSRPARAAR